MQPELNRRDALKRTLLGIGSYFCVGRLEADAEQVDESDRLAIAAAATFETAIQKVVIPYGLTDGEPQLSAETKAELTEMSQLLDPSTAPPVFNNASVGVEQVYCHGSVQPFRCSVV